MSHIVKVKLRVTNIEALAAAAEMVGCELVDTQSFYWFRGNTPCAYAIRLKEDSPFRKEPWSYGGRKPFEIGVMRHEDESGVYYELEGDPHMGGFGLMWAVGSKLWRDGETKQVERDQNGIPTARGSAYDYPHDFDRLREEYAAQTAAIQLRLEGYSVTFGWNTEGEREVYAEALAF